MSNSIYRIKLYEDVANHIADNIRAGLWTPGTRLPTEAELASHFDVSRSTVREAIKSLQIAGILHSRSGSGTYVCDSAPLVLHTKDLTSLMIDADSLHELVQARVILEPELAALAAKQADETDISALRQTISDMQAQEDRLSLMQLGYQFHQQLADSSHNRILAGFYHSAASQLRAMRVLDSLTLEIYLDGIGDHLRILNAIEIHDPTLARIAMLQHLRKDYAQYLDSAK